MLADASCAKCFQHRDTVVACFQVPMQAPVSPLIPKLRHRYSRFFLSVVHWPLCVQARDKHFVQVLHPMFTFQYLTGKVDSSECRPQAITRMGYNSESVVLAL